jgi:acyl dehydratase
LTDGLVLTTQGRTVTEADIVLFAGLSGDFHPIHTNEVFARETPVGRRVAHGALILSMSIGLTTRLNALDDTLLALAALDKVRFSAPVVAGDTISVEKRVAATLAMDATRGAVTFHTRVMNQEGRVVISYADKILLKRKP